MLLIFQERQSDSPFIERVWCSHSERAGRFLSVAQGHLELVITRLGGKTTVTLRGPETKATEVVCPADGQWFAIRFKLGTFMPALPASQLLDRNDVTLPSETGRSFWLNASEWECPDFDNAEAFVQRLADSGVIVRDAAVEAALRGDRKALSARSAQRHFMAATGLTHTQFRQIERARYATNLLRRGVSILDTVHEAGYFDQAHLTRSVKHLVGQTPAKIANGAEQLSFLYKTALVR